MTRWAHWTAAAALVVTPTHGGDLKSGINPSFFDTTVRPQDDFYRYVNGGWLKTAEIPPDRPADGAFYKLRDEAEENLRRIIEETVQADHPEGSEPRKIADLYRSFMDEERVERLGLEPVRGELAAIDAITDSSELPRAFGELARRGVGGPFALFVMPDAKQSDTMIVYLNQAGLGLPDEAFYREPKYAPIRDEYVKHIARSFEIAGLPDPQGSAQRIMALETRLAASHLDRVRNRDRDRTYNKMSVDQLQDLTPGFDWAAYGAALQAPTDLIHDVIVRQPDYLVAMAKAVVELPLEDWKLKLKWGVLRSAAPYLNQAMSDENFRFYSQVLNGVPEQRPRWKRGVALVEAALGEALGKLYVERHFPPEAKARMQELVHNLVEAYRQSITDLDWMSQETKSKALAKLDKFTPKIGYPDKWRDYSGLEIKADDLVGNVRRSDAFDLDYNLSKLGKPVDRDEWHMTPQTVNAYYNATLNEIVFPAAILQPPFFDLQADDAVNYGGIGAVIGHEIGHGFDDQGSKSDGDGNLVNWWTESDRKEFEKRTAMLIEQYNQFEPAQLPGEKVNGALTVGENIGDLGGLTIAYKAYLRSLNGQEPPVLDGLTGPQRFFVGFAQIWRAKFRDAALRQRLATDPHSPAEFRCNGPLSNFDAFYEAFGVQEGDKLYLPPEKRVRIW
ncbi:MAG: putative zinc metalloprotease [Isosphaeraceae bacterium]|jgi:putative endopeptidase|nr:MAG: putative zinc metalloprotease [Isosphaeraceae bacterium]